MALLHSSSICPNPDKDGQDTPRDRQSIIPQKKRFAKSKQSIAFRIVKKLHAIIQQTGSGVFSGLRLGLQIMLRNMAKYLTIVRPHCNTVHHNIPVWRAHHALGSLAAPTRTRAVPFSPLIIASWNPRRYLEHEIPATPSVGVTGL